MKLSWSELKDIVARLSREIPESVSTVVGVGRSGLAPAALLCRYAGLGRFLAVFVRKYGEGKPPPRIHEKPVVTWGFNEGLGGEGVVIVDDIAVTGQTLSVVREYVKARGAGEVYTMVIVKKPGASVDFYGLETEECVEFPWE